jgi:ubiquinone/menaquinone biosynthesis C-methylase UbiE
LLKIAHERKFIHSFSAENAERMSFLNNSFDYVYCKESFHHFSRPYAALYEMYRVARKGVILTEPRDTSIDKEPLELFKDLIKTLLGKSTRSSHGFEPIGNYIYSISEKEMEKAAMGLSSNTIATIGCNDVYRDGIEFISQLSKKDEDIKFSNAIKSELKHMDLLCKFGIKKTTLLTVVLFKNTPDVKLLSKMSDCDWKIKSLPKNPYK